MVLSEILHAREQRTAKRLAIASKGCAGISLSFNIPGFPKSNDQISKAFNLVVGMLEDFLLAHRILIGKDKISPSTDAAGDFYLCKIAESSKSISEIKNLCEQFEQHHPLQRIIDVDVMDSSGKPISSGKEKKCFLCENPAIFCMRNQSHKIEDINEFIESGINQFLRNKKLEQTKLKLSELATQCLLYELSLSPKPGLVDRFGSGAHQDMDYFTFLNSISSLSGYWSQLVELAFDKNFKEKNAEIEKLRALGLSMERAMLQATEGVNTQKGAIFLIGMLVYTAAKLINEDKIPNNKNLPALLKDINNDILKDELLLTKEVITHGQEIYKKYGKETGGGIRNEMAKGLPVVFNHALPYLEAALKKKSLLMADTGIQPALIRCLLTIISKNNDSNVLYRTDIDTLQKLQNMAGICLKDEVHFENNYKKIREFCLEKNISPGGSADLLAATIFVYQLKNITF